MSAKIINKDNFNEVINSDRRVLLDFFSPNCTPCRMVSPVVDKIADEHSEILVGKVNVAEEADLARQFRVSGVPTFLVMEKGEVIKKSTGAMREAGLLSLLEM